MNISSIEEAATLDVKKKNTEEGREGRQKKEPKEGRENGEIRTGSCTNILGPKAKMLNESFFYKNFKET